MSMYTLKTYLYCLLLLIVSAGGCTRQLPKTKPILSAPLPMVQIITATPRYLRVVIFSDPCFKSDNTRLTPICERKLSKLLDTLIDYPSRAPIQIRGYQANIFDPKTAALIARQHASTIALYLWNNGISSHRLNIQVARHPSTFVASNRHMGTSYANRRVEVTIG